MYSGMMRPDVEGTAISGITGFPTFCRAAVCLYVLRNLPTALSTGSWVSSLLCFLSGILFALCLMVSALVSLRPHSTGTCIAVAVSLAALATKQWLRNAAVNPARLVNADDSAVLILLCSNVLSSVRCLTHCRCACRATLSATADGWSHHMYVLPCCLQAVAFYMFTHPAGSSKPSARSAARAAEASEQYGVEAAVDEVAPLSAAEGQQLREGVLHDLLEVSHQRVHRDKAW